MQSSTFTDLHEDQPVLRRDPSTDRCLVIAFRRDWTVLDPLFDESRFQAACWTQSNIYGNSSTIRAL